MLFEKSDAGVSSVAIDRAVVMRVADQILALMEKQKDRWRQWVHCRMSAQH